MKKGEEQQEKVAMMTPKKVRGTATIYADGDIYFLIYRFPFLMTIPLYEASTRLPCRS